MYYIHKLNCRLHRVSWSKRGRAVPAYPIMARRASLIYGVHWERMWRRTIKSVYDKITEVYDVTGRQVTKGEFE